MFGLKRFKLNSIGSRRECSSPRATAPNVVDLRKTAPDLNPVPTPPMVDLTNLGLEREHLKNLEPIVDLEHLALQAALLTGDAVELFDRIAAAEVELGELRAWRIAHERRGNHCRRCAGRG